MVHAIIDEAQCTQTHTQISDNWHSLRSLGGYNKSPKYSYQFNNLHDRWQA